MLQHYITYLTLIVKNVKTKYIATKVETELGHLVCLGQLGHALSRSSGSDHQFINIQI